jgi:lipopolysaccharide transport system ATP-binding protein
MMTPAILVDDLRKCYKLGSSGRRAGYRTLRESLAALPRLAIRARRDRPAPGLEGDFWALRGVDLEVNPGEVVGIIGRNGAGKSTLLKILSRITRPTTGRVELRGRVGSLLEVGTGFHPELTGRENIFLNAAILGMKRAEVARNFDEIVAFAEVEKFLDTPVKHYSSGMYVRLAFAVAAHLETEILLVDEVLAVGDAEFQRRCTDKMRSVSRSGRTVLFVSHNMPSVEHLCNRCILLSGGTIEADGETSRVLAVYNQGVGGALGPVASLEDHEGRTLDSTPSMSQVEVGPGRGGAGTRTILMGDDIEIKVKFEVKERLQAGVTFGVVVKNSRNSSLFGINNLVIPSPALDRPIRRGEVSCRLVRPPLMPGSYSLDLFLGTRGHNFDVVLDACRFEVLPTDHFGSGRLPPRQAGDVYCPATWGLEDDD